MTTCNVRGIVVTLEQTDHGVIASAKVKGTLNYKHKKLYDGYTQKQILSKFVREVKEIERE